MNDPRQRLEQLPAAGLGQWPTPLERLDRFGAAVGCEVWIKRDDIQGVALAGNKVRKYELVLGRALADGVDTLVTAGAIQSNSARAGAASAVRAGMDCVLFLSGDAPEQPFANLLLDRLLGADVRFAGDADWRALNDGVDAIVGELGEQGRHALAAPVGCSSPLGALGFALAFLELDAQLTAVGVEPEAIVHTTTSGGTHAGLLVGRELTDRKVRLVGVDAAAMFDDPADALIGLARRSAEMIGLDLDVDASQVEVVTNQIGRRYGAHTPEAVTAIGLLARTEAIITDPVYSGKGLAGLIDLVRTGALTGPIVFWHTGGYHALFDPTHGTPLASSLAAESSSSRRQ